MYQALYRKYRPQTFDDMVGQQAVTQTLKTQILSNKLSHAYLFTGSRGTGKTSSAKILAKAVNCENPQDGNPCNCCSSCRAIDSGSCMDVLEIDAASNNGVDNVRDLRDDAIYSPSQVKKRVYIIDEVHMLSLSAFNALLKIIEEPPEHLIFILATTELHKVPATILSRCQRFSFRRISQEDIAARLQYVAYQEDIELDESAARILARLADGGLRDALSLLDQCASATVGELNADRVYACLGIAGIQQCASLMEYIADRDTAKALSLLNRFYAEGEGVGMLSGVATDAEAAALSNRFSYGELVRMVGVIQATLASFNRSASRRMDAELCVVNLCQPELDADLTSVIARITKLEDQIRSGVVMQQAAQAQPNVDNSTRMQSANDLEPAQVIAAEIQPSALEDEAPVGFWADIVAGVKSELSPAFRGFFAISANSPIRGILSGDRLLLVCTNKYVIEMVNKPDIISLVARKASAKLGRPIRVAVTDGSGVQENNEQMEKLLDFGRSHSDIIKISED